MTRDANLLGALCTAVDESILEAAAARTGLGAPAAEALVSVRTRPGLTIEALARILGLSHSGTVRVVDRLEARDLVVRRRAGREVGLHLTRRGSRLAGDVLRARAETVDSLLDRLPASSRHHLVGAVSRLLAALTTSREGARHTCRLCDQAGCTQPGLPCPVDKAASAHGE